MRLTSYAMEELECPKCGHKHSLRKYKVINVTEKAKLKEDILKNRLFQFSCDSCEYMAPLTYDSLYVDSQRNIMIYMTPVMNTEIKEEIAALEQEQGPDKRLVDNINDLKEKIMIADNHLDDRVIEIIKIMYLDQIKKEMEEDTLLNILFDYNRDNYCFLVFFQKKGIGKIEGRKYYKYDSKKKKFVRDRKSKVVQNAKKKTISVKITTNNVNFRRYRRYRFKVRSYVKYSGKKIFSKLSKQKIVTR